MQWKRNEIKCQKGLEKSFKRRYWWSVESGFPSKYSGYVEKYSKNVICNDVAYSFVFLCWGYVLV